MFPTRSYSIFKDKNKIWAIFLICFLTFSNLTGISFSVRSITRRRGPLGLQSECPPDFEKKFLPPDGKCHYSGFVPVKGSCTAYIPCVSFGGDLMKPMKRTECPKSVGLAFDINDLRCRPTQDVNTCLQRTCFPQEARIEDGILPPPIYRKQSDSPPKLDPGIVVDEEKQAVKRGGNEDIIISLDTEMENDYINGTNIISNQNKTHDYDDHQYASSSSSLTPCFQILLNNGIIPFVYYILGLRYFSLF